MHAPDHSGRGGCDRPRSGCGSDPGRRRQGSGNGSNRIGPFTSGSIFHSPAKINLFFRVLRKRSDGYHEIASLYQSIDLCDSLEFTKEGSDSLTCSDPELTVGNDNLVIKALNLFRDNFPLPFGVKIHLEKRIPIQSGLGGGSSNAATTLWALNELAGCPASIDQLSFMGASLGSDVPFFFSEGTAYCTGRGETREPFTLPCPIAGWIAKPKFGLSTPLVYRDTRVSELQKRDPRQSLAEYPLFYNDLEPAAFRLAPSLIDFRRQLEGRGFDSVTMTGSGTAFFCLKETVPKPGIWRPQVLRKTGMTPFRSIQRTPNAWYSLEPVLKPSFC